MKYHQLIAALTEEPLLITPAAHGSLLKLFEEHRALSGEEFRAKREGQDFCGEEVALEQMEIRDGIAFIPIGGPIGRNLGKFEKGAGAVDSGDVMEDLDDAEDDDSVSGIILVIDSPGGMVAGTAELADRVLRCDKPIYAFTSGLMCSAAYWIGSACDGVFCTKTATVANVGVFAPFLDQSKRFEAQGVKVQVIASGKYKGAGVPGTSLSEDHMAHMQERVNEMALMFSAHVLACRPDAVMEDLQGQAFLGPTAAAKGLVDQVVEGIEDVEAMLRG